jgi:hypothetical protein
MGRGLSNLQKDILGIVYERRQGRDFAEEERRQTENRKDPMHQRMMLLLHGREDNEPYSYRDYPDADNAQVMRALYDWPLRRSWGSSGFRRSVIGEQEYNRRTAAYYRSVKRLKRRGLLEDHRRGLLITDEGIKMAQKLSVSRVRRAPHTTNRIASLEKHELRENSASTHLGE